ncbi:group I truncated hemoglobin [Pigmentibacter ruber]|uniref:group I truncated hemoglobin n=1 Tax=Pigmentibacter ruber TaxID=2683196 RepID=UPI00131E63CD|nr:group 1 truncated hemoglobin [Pigmentibacter ruber]
MGNTLYSKYGGFDAIQKVVSLFYKKVLASDNLYRFFENTDMTKLIEHQTQFFSTALGGPQGYDVKKIKTAHQNLKINEADFSEVVKLLKETLEEVKIERNDITTILTAIGGFKNDIVTA